MRMRVPGWAACRAVIAVAALYALALHVVLGTAVFPASFGPAHILCAPEAGTPDAPDGKHPVHGHLPCCPSAQAGAGLVAPALAAQPVVWPVPAATRIAWRPETVALPRAPPRRPANARAPPVA
ncbi:hypothetical protein LKMONMHP_0216 [Methylobacterium organophilum]|uniref:DUF2946 domain-containing protein n=3 Tax=Methylobacterium organophilum TaxID=410 RepID=A0ABQ4T381_METOR|nr:hypothetical protein [Methylobacterium organophilum]UMY20057.1 hypothetical protein MMB17_07220 [Methylobacterium organophilum]GJE25379.1 hypothetical protein LKMONMHP_0216 [Methylobacterium organophilum]